jgi:crotonobetainyl-CoA:carnitine CoA-transferase CaiB-like acyl-CoA transferase
VSRPLEDLVVVDASQGVAGGYAGRLLADLGARVVKVEPPEGDRLRRLGPFPGDEPDDERGGLHLALNAGKESVVADLEHESGRARLLELVSGADIFLESSGPTGLRASGLGYADVADEHPALVYASQSPFGLDGRYAERVSSEIVDYAMGGFMYFSGAPEAHPLLVPGHQGELHAGMQLATGAVLGAWHARQTGVGQHVDVSTFESMLNAHCWLTTSWTHEGEVQSRLPSTITPCADGHVFWFPRPDAQLFAHIGRLDMLDDTRFQTIAGFREALPELRAAVAEWARDRTKAEIYHAAQEMRIAFTPVNTTEDLANSEQLAAREFWRPLEHSDATLGDGGRVDVPGPPWRFSDAEVGPTVRAPRLGEHDDLRLEPGPTREARGDAGAQPLEGIRVLEVTANWAGPLTGRHLGDMGADVIKFEAPNRTATRGAHQAGGQLWNTPYNRAGYFNLLNRNKRDLVVDLRHDEGRAVFLDLLDSSDVVLENNSARVFPNLGLPYDVLAERNPRVVMCSMSGMGASGPEMHYLAYGSNIEASSGLVSQLGYGDGRLFSTGTFYADPICGTHGTLGILAALFQRERSGRGQFIDMALQESGIAFQIEAIMDRQLNGRVAGPMNNRSRPPQGPAPQGAYPSLGIDCWLAVAVETDAQWAALCELIDRPELLERFASVEARRSGQDEIDVAIAEWSRVLDHNEATRRLQAAGLPAGPVLANWEIVSDPHLFDRGYFVDIVHPEVGHYRWDGYPWHLSKTPGRIRLAAPLYGEHNDEALRDAGRTPEQIASLRTSGVVADVPDIDPGLRG